MFHFVARSRWQCLELWGRGKGLAPTRHFPLDSGPLYEKGAARV
jgi:hypothetical protein